MGASAAVGAVEIGGSHVAAARVRVDARSVVGDSRHRIALAPDAPRDDLLVQIRDVARRARPADRWGVAVPGPFDYERGICLIQGVAKLDALYGTDLGAELAAATGVPGDRIGFLNDADAFLLGEWWAGAARGCSRAIGITLGSGLGSAFLVEGRITESGGGVPSEGRLDLVPFEGRPVEEVISRRGLLRAYAAERAATTERGAAAERPAREATLDVADIAVRAADGEPAALRTFRRFGDALGRFLAPWVAEFRCDCLVVGGGIAHAWRLFEPAFMRACPPAADLRCCGLAEHLDDAALIGAAMHVARAPGST